MADYWLVFVGVWMNGFGIGWLSLNAVNAMLEKKLCRSRRKTALDDGSDPGELAYGSPGMRVGLDASDPEFDSQSPLLGRMDQALCSELNCTEGKCKRRTLGCSAHLLQESESP